MKTLKKGKYILIGSNTDVDKLNMNELLKELDSIEEDVVKRPSLIYPIELLPDIPFIDVTEHSPIFIPKRSKRKGYQK